MDAKDVRIFCEMAFGTTSFGAISERHAGPSEIGKKVGLDEKTVRLRIKKMEEEGFIKYYQVAPNLKLFGLDRVGFYRFEALNLTTKHKVVEYTHEVPFVVETLDYLGQAVSISIAGASSADVERVADSISSRFELSRWGIHEAILGSCPYLPDRLDWRIIKELRFSARRSTADLAGSLSITARMGEYRRGRLLESGAMLIRASIDHTKQTGLVFYELELILEEGSESSVARLLAEKYGERLWSTLLSRRVLLASLFGFSLSEPEEAAIKAGRIDGVKSCTLYILKEVIEPRGPNWIDRSIDGELAKI